MTSLSRHELYGGRIILEYDDDKHSYTVNGNYVPSVTGILNVIAKPALIPWALNMGVRTGSPELEEIMRTFHRELTELASLQHQLWGEMYGNQGTN